MEKVQKVHQAANEALGKAIEELDKKIRPVQRAYFNCCYLCSDDSRAAVDVPSCISRCQEPMIRVQEALGQAQDTFQERIGKCHGFAGSQVDDSHGTLAASGKPSTEQLEAYANALQPCVETEVKKIHELLVDVHSKVPTSLADIRTATPTGITGLDGTSTKKGWFQ